MEAKTETETDWFQWMSFCNGALFCQMWLVILFFSKVAAM